MTTTILVTGGSGSIGREIVAALAAHAEARVLVGSRDPRRGTVELDLGRPETIGPALAGVDKIAVVSPLAPDMVRQMGNLAAAARGAQVRHIVRSSLIGVDEPDPITEAEWHAAADEAIRASGIPCTFLRPTAYFQNFLNAATTRSIREQGLVRQPLDGSRVSYVDTRDLGAVAARVLLAPGDEHHGRAYVLTGGEAYAMDQVAEAFTEALGKPVRYAAVEPAAFRGGLLGAGVPEVITDAILGWFAYCRAGRADRVSEDVESLLGRKPIGLAAFVRDHADRFR